jgi:hypothetical protein
MGREHNTLFAAEVILSLQVEHAQRLQAPVSLLLTIVI